MLHIINHLMIVRLPYHELESIVLQFLVIQENCIKKRDIHDLTVRKNVCGTHLSG